MFVPHIQLRRPIDRRAFLRSTGTVAIGLPLLEAMEASIGQRALANSETVAPRRFVAMCAGLGFHGPHFFPDDAETDAFRTPYLSQLKEFQELITVFAGLSHPNQQGNNGHASSFQELRFTGSIDRPTDRPRDPLSVSSVVHQWIVAIVERQRSGDPWDDFTSEIIQRFIFGWHQGTNGD